MNYPHIKNISVSYLNAPLIQPFRTALGTHDRLENLLFTLELSNGTKGFGEAAIATHITGETIRETQENLNLVAATLIGEDISDYLHISSQLHERFSNNKAAIAAIEMALIDALTRQLKIPLWKFFGNQPKQLVSDITIVIADLNETEDSVKKFYKQGFRTFKVKIGRDQDLDLKRVLAVHKITKGSAIILDANQGYSVDEILRFLKSIKRFGVRPELVEQPIRKGDWEGLRRISQLAGLPVCADESVRSLSDAQRAIREKAVSVISVKLMKSGIFEAREISLLAKACGIKLMISGMMESSLAMTASAHLASGLGFFDYIDLDTPFFIKEGLKNNPYLNSRGVYNLKKVREGIGIIPQCPSSPVS